MSFWHSSTLQSSRLLVYTKDFLILGDNLIARRWRVIWNNIVSQTSSSARSLSTYTHVRAASIRMLAPSPSTCCRSSFSLALLLSNYFIWFMRFVVPVFYCTHSSAQLVNGIFPSFCCYVVSTDFSDRPSSPPLTAREQPPANDVKLSQLRH